jgi:hypothetical protein
MPARIPHPFLAVVSLSLLLAAALAGSGQAQTADPPANLPPEIVARTVPSRVVYLGSEPGATANVMIVATGTTDPDGQALDYACDANGDGVFTPWFFHEPCAENVTMAGPFVAELHVRDADKAIASQGFHMEARQFEHGYVDAGWGAPTLAVVAGRPAVTYMGSDGLRFAINSQRDGGGAWTDAPVLPIDGSRQGPEPLFRPCPLAVIAGRPAVACAYETGKGWPVMFAQNARADGSGKWAAEEAVVLAGDSAPALGTIVAGPAIAYFQDGAVTLLVGQGAIGPDPVMVSKSFELLWSFDVGGAPPASHSGVVQVGGPAALPALAFLDAQKGVLTYAVNQQRDGRGKWDVVAVEPQTGDIGTPSLATVDGRPAIAYRDGARGPLKVAVASTANGLGAWTVKTVAPRAGAGRGQALATIDGRLAVAYEDENRGLVFAYDPGADYGDYWPSAVVDARVVNFSQGFFMSPSLAMVAGRPGIAYNSVGGIQFTAAR